MREFLILLAIPVVSFHLDLVGNDTLVDIPLGHTDDGRRVRISDLDECGVRIPLLEGEDTFAANFAAVGCVVLGKDVELVEVWMLVSVSFGKDGEGAGHVAISA